MARIAGLNILGRLIDSVLLSRHVRLIYFTFPSDAVDLLAMELQATLASGAS